MFEKGSEVVDFIIEGKYKWKVWIKIYLVLFLGEEFFEEIVMVGKICEEVFKMGKEFEMESWFKKEDFEKFYRKI